MVKTIWTDEHSQSHAKFLRENPLPKTWEVEIDDEALPSCLSSWLIENCEGRYEIEDIHTDESRWSSTIIFQDEQDLVAFKLRWLS